MSNKPKALSKTIPILGLILAALVIAILLLRGPSLPNYDYDGIHTEFSGEKAFAHVSALVEMGPRPSGTKALERNRVYIEEQLAKVGWQTERQTFTDKTPIGDIQFSNLRARFGRKDDQHLWKRRAFALIGSHYDTKLYRDIRFVGANDAGSSSGALIELARVAAGDPEFAKHLELVFFDGEEAIVEFGDADGLYGSRHYATTITRHQTENQRPLAVVILDMVGEKDLSIRIPSDTPEELREAFRATAKELGYERYTGFWRTPVLDDHVPFSNEGVPAIDLIDFDYQAWHTPRDTMDRLDPKSLEISGQIALMLVGKHILGR